MYNHAKRMHRDLRCMIRPAVHHVSTYDSAEVHACMALGGGHLRLQPEPIHQLRPRAAQQPQRTVEPGLPENRSSYPE